MYYPLLNILLSVLSRNFPQWRKSLSRLHNSTSLCQITMPCPLFAHIFGFSKDNIRRKLKTAGKIVSATKSNTTYLLQHLAHIHITKINWMQWEITEYSSPWKGCFYHVVTKTHRLHCFATRPCSPDAGTTVSISALLRVSSEVSVWQRAEHPVRWKLVITWLTVIM